MPFIDYMQKNGIPVIFHYQSLHNSKMGQKYRTSEYPVTESVENRIVRLPFYNELSKQEQSIIIDDILNF